MTLTLRRLALLSSTVVAAAAVPALAADPESGTVSNASPKVEWSGVAAGYGTSIVADINGSFPPCQAPNCDEFALEVADQADLTVAATDSSGTGFTTMEVQGPDGTITYNGGADGEPTTTIKLKKAKIGSYVVRVMTNSTAADPDYTGVASLAVAAPAPASGGTGSTPPPASAPSAAPQPPPASSTATITVKPGRYSARKLKRKLTVALSSDGPVSNLVATLKRGSKTVGKGKLASLDGKGKIALKVSRLTKGAHVFRVAGKAADGSVVATTVKLKITR